PSPLTPAPVPEGYRHRITGRAWKPVWKRLSPLPQRFLESSLGPLVKGYCGTFPWWSSLAPHSPPFSMPTFHTVKEAATLTRKSPSSIRRIIYPIIHDDKHADRKHVQPTVEEAKKLRLKGDNFAWRISEELLRRELPAESRAAHGATAAPSRVAGSPDAELLSILRAEL